MNTLYKNRIWHSLNSKEILNFLNVNSEQGIASDEVEKRQTKYGFNSTYSKKRDIFNKTFFSSVSSTPC